MFLRCGRQLLPRPVELPMSGSAVLGWAVIFPAAGAGQTRLEPAATDYFFYYTPSFDTVLGTCVHAAVGCFFEHLQE